MKTFFASSLLFLLALPCAAQFERSVPIVSVRHPAQVWFEEAPAPNFGAADEERMLAIDASLPERLQHALDSLIAKTSDLGKHGVSAAVIVPGLPMWTGGAGESYPGTPMNSGLRFEIASNTKTFTTALIMQLTEEGKLSLTDSLWKWLPSYNNVDSTITIRQLLDHSSGIYDYLNDDPAGTVIVDAYVNNPDKVWMPDEIVEGYLGPANFKAGTSYRYSNTNFLLLGMIVEKVTGVRYGSELHRRFLDPLGLTNTFVGWEDPISGDFAHNWIYAGNNIPMVDLGYVEKTAQLSMTHSAGGNVSIPGDLALWVKSLYEGTLLAPSSKSAMITMHTWPNGSRYGLGTARVPYGSRSFYGHNGRLLGFESDMFNNPKDSVTFVIYLNSDPLQGDISLNDYAIAILNEIYKPAAGVSEDVSLPLHISAAPNPLSAKTTINYELPKATQIRLAVYNSLGEEIAVLANSMSAAGGHSASFDASRLAAGIYTYRLLTPYHAVTGQLAIVK